MTINAIAALRYQSAATNTNTNARSMIVSGIWPVKNWRIVSSWRKRSLINPVGVVSKCR